MPRVRQQQPTERLGQFWSSRASCRWALAKGRMMRRRRFWHEPLPAVNGLYRASAYCTPIVGEGIVSGRVAGVFCSLLRWGSLSTLLHHVQALGLEQAA